MKITKLVLLITTMFLVGCSNHSENDIDNSPSTQDTTSSVVSNENVVDSEVELEEKEIVLEAYELLKVEDYVNIRSILPKLKEFESDYKYDGQLIALYATIKMEFNGNNIMPGTDSETLKSLYPKTYITLRSFVAQKLSQVSPDPTLGLEQFDYRDFRLKLLHELERIDFTEDTWQEIYDNPALVSEYEDKSNAIGSPPSIGMTKDEVLFSSWGKPTDINTTTSGSGTSEQWVYPDFKYIYFDDGVVTAIQE